MKYEMDIEIDLPRETVVELFSDHSKMFKWMPTLTDFKPISGTPGDVGAVAELTHKMGKRTVTMRETVTKKELPELYCGTYTAKGCVNHVENVLLEVGPSKTKWIVRTEFICTGLMWLMVKVMPGGFKKQTRLYMKSFKEFAESAGN